MAYGVCSAIRIFVNNVLMYSVTGLSADAAKLSDFAYRNGDTQEGYAYVLQGIDVVFGYAGNDTIRGEGGNDRIDGGAGTDTVAYGGARTQYKITKTLSGFAVADRIGDAGADTLSNVKQIQFADTSISVKYVDAVQALYVAYFGWAADTTGLMNFQAQLDAIEAPTDLRSLTSAYASDSTVRTLVDAFGNSEESKSLYTGDTKAFVAAIYNNVLNRNPDADGLTF